MEDSIDVGDIEDIIYACTEETEQRVDNKEEGEKERRSLVGAGDEAHHQDIHETKTKKKGGDHQLKIDDEERKDEVEKEGGLTLINQVIFNLMSPTEDGEVAKRKATDDKMDQEDDDKIQGDTESQGSSKTEEEFEFDREGQEQEEKVKVSDEQAKSEAGSGGSGIVDSIISSLPASLSLSSENAAPDTDEASFLIHSIVHD